MCCYYHHSTRKLWNFHFSFQKFFLSLCFAKLFRSKWCWHWNCISMDECSKKKKKVQNDKNAWLCFDVEIFVPTTQRPFIFLVVCVLAFTNIQERHWCISEEAIYVYNLVHLVFNGKYIYVIDGGRKNVLLNFRKHSLFFLVTTVIQIILYV